MHIHNLFGKISEDSWHAGDSAWSSEHDQWAKESADTVPALTGVDEQTKASAYQHHVVSKLDGNVLASYKTREEAQKNAYGNPVVSGSLETIGDREYVRDEVAEETGDNKFDNMMNNVKQPGAIEQTIKQLSQQKEQAEHQLAQVREATRAIKYEDTVNSIIGQVTQIAQSNKQFDQRELKWWANGLGDLKAQLEEKVYEIEDAFKDIVRSIDDKIEELQYELDYPEDLEEDAEQLNIGDPVIITGKGIQYEGATGEIIDFGKDKRFVVVNLYNHGKHSFHSSDVSYNDYADSDDEEMRMYDREPGMMPHDDIDEGDVIHHKFGMKQDQKGKTPYYKNPDIEVPTYDRKLGKAWNAAYSRKNKQEPFDSFEVEPAGSSSAHIIGVTRDGKKVRISTTSSQLADVLANAYNRNGFTDATLQKVPLGDMDEGRFYNGSRDPIQAAMDREKREFKRQELEHELRGEEEAERRERDTIYYILVNGKILKKDGIPFQFRGKAAANGAAMKMMSKDFNKGKSFHLTTVNQDKPELAAKSPAPSAAPQQKVFTFFDVGRGGKSFTDAQLSQLGLRQSKNGKWFVPTDNPATVGKIEQALNVKGKTWSPPVKEDSNDFMAADSTSPVGGKVDESTELRDSIYERLKGWILTKDPEFITRNGGPEAVMNAMEDVADWYGDSEEFGSSDFTACLQSLFRHFGEKFDRTKYYTNEGYYKKLKEERDAKAHKKAYSMLGELKNILDK
jgi:hypothetical protein